MLERLTERLNVLAEQQRQSAILSIIWRSALPPGVEIEAVDAGVLLSGKGLLRRYLTEINIRNLGQ